jgi:hypothetical protein
MKPEYRLFNKDCPHGSYVSVPKSVLDYFLARSRVSEETA